ncbi:MAG: InlB B-repeat-containing protein [Ruminococcus sp.]|nr:InlB B-repeat-containing protein [Ruminococcus sp.]
MLKTSFSKWIASVLSFAVILSLFAAAAPLTYAAESFFDTAEQLAVKDHIEEDASLTEYATAQGSCSDGEYAYVAVQNGYTTLLKYDLNSFVCVDSSDRISGLGHANDMTYNTKEHLIAVANNAPDYDIITLIDPDTFTPTGNVKIKLDIYSIAYCAQLDCYFVGISGGYDFACLDKEFNVVKEYKGVDTGYTRQGCDCDGSYLYFAQSGGSGNIIVVYSLDGTYVDTIAVDNSDEIESIFHSGTDFYATFHYYGNFIFRLGLSEQKKITYTVHYDKGAGEGEMADTVVHYGEDTKLSKNLFTRSGYFFAGWTLQRSCDKKILGFTPFSDEAQWLDPQDVNDYALEDDESYVSETVRNGSVTLTPFFIKEHYNVVYGAEEGAQGYLPPELVAYQDEIVIPENIYSKTGFVFDGFIATRSVDNKTYGYLKGSDTPEWLPENLLDRPHRFYEGDTAVRMTYDGEIRMTASFKPAFSYSEDKSELLSYVGVDENVDIPDNGGALTEITEHCFLNNDSVSTVNFPSCVMSLDSGAIENCPSLQSVTFSDTLPSISGDAVKDSGAPAVYLKKDGKSVFLGWLTDEITVAQLNVAEKLIFD